MHAPEQRSPVDAEETPPSKDDARRRGKKSAQADAAPAINLSKPREPTPGRRKVSAKAGISEGHGQKRLDLQGASAAPLTDSTETRPSINPTDDPTINRIIYLWRLRQRWHRAEKALVLQGKALCRALSDGDKKAGSDLYDRVAEGKESDDAILLALGPFLQAQEPFRLPRERFEKELAKLARTLPGYAFVKRVHGVGDQGFASIIGEAGDIGRYTKGVAGVWKRLGLAVIGGERQRCKSDAEEALAHGYNPARRSVVWNLGNGLIGGMGRGKRPAPGEDISLREDWTDYQKLFVERCRFECARDPVAFPLATVEKDGELRESYPKHAQARAKRFVEKRFIRELIAAWRKDAGVN